MGVRLIRLAIVGLVALMALAPTAAGARPAKIAFVRNGDLYSLRLGHRPVKLTTTEAHEHQPAWAPGHARLAFAVGRRSVGVLDLATGRRRVIARLPDRIDAIQALAWSPVGDLIAMGATDEFRRHGSFRLNGTVWIVHADGTALRPIVSGQGLVTGLAWMPHGGRILASTEWPNGVILWRRHAPLGIISFAPDGSRLHLVKETLASNVDLSPDGRRAVYRGWSRTCHACGEIWRMSTDGSGAHVIALPPKGFYGLYQPRYSPTGEQVALIVAGGKGPSLWVMRPDGSHLHRVLDDVQGLDW